MWSWFESERQESLRLPNPPAAVRSGRIGCRETLLNVRRVMNASAKTSSRDSSALGRRQFFRAVGALTTATSAGVASGTFFPAPILAQTSDAVQRANESLTLRRSAALADRNAGLPDHVTNGDDVR